MIIEPRWRIEHSQNILPLDQQRFADMKVIASMQPSHAIGDLHFAHKRLGIDRLSNAYTWRSLIDGYFQDYWNLDESVSRQEALYMFTKWASYSVFEEDIKGTVEVGKLADLTIFSKDIMTIPEEEIMSSEIVMTIVGGEVVYSQ